MSGRDPRALAIGAATALVVVAGGLLVQHLRHGFPFSLHHGYAPAEQSPEQSAASPAHVADHDSGTETSHPRATLELSAAEANAIGVRLEQVRSETLARPIRAVATVVPDESRLSHVHTRVAGWIERLHVNTTGERVRAGAPLAAIFSQELLSSQTEYLSVRRAAGTGPASAVLESARTRLRVLGMTDSEIDAIERSGVPRRLVTVTSPRSGVVLRRGIAVGTAVDPSTEIVTVADLSRVWVLAEVPESDIPLVEVGTPAVLEFRASGREAFDAKVAFLYPTLTERTRTLRVRFEVDNRHGALRPGLYGTATFHVTPAAMPTVSRDAVVDTGPTQYVFVAQQPGVFVPTEVQLGRRIGERVEVRQGLEEGMTVVASGVFLLDSESRLRASGGGTGHAHGSPEPPTDRAPPAGPPTGAARPARPARAAPGSDAPPPARTGPAAVAEPNAPHGSHAGH